MVKFRYALLALLCTTQLTQASTQPLRIGMIATIPPYVYKQTDRGIEVDLIREALRRAGQTSQNVYTPLERVIYGFKTGQLDAAATMDTSSGLKGYYSAPYIEFHHVAITLAARKMRIARIEDLSQYRVVSFRRATGFLGSAYAAAVHASPRYVEEDNDVNLNRLLNNGSVDVVVGDERIFRAIMAQQPDAVSHPVQLHHIFPAKPYSMVFRDERLRNAFDHAMAEMRADGTYTRIVSSYLDRLPPLGERPER